MTDHIPVQRYFLNVRHTRNVMLPVVNKQFTERRGDWVLYAEHVAALSACEERVREDEQSHNFSPDIHWDGMAEAYLRGIDAAREAVLGAKAIDIAYGRGWGEPPQFIWLNNALSAIDALRGGTT